MRIGITGVTGFIGRALAAEASRRGAEVIGYSRKIQDPGLIPGVKKMRTLHEGNDDDRLLDVQDLDVLVHLAGESVFGYWTEGKKRRIRDSRVHLTQRLVQQLSHAAQEGKKVPVFICGSGAGAYGDRGDEILTEEAGTGQGFLAEVCREWEAAAMQAEQFGTRVVCLRTGMVLGNEGGAWQMLRQVFRFFLGSPLGTGASWVPWIHLDDEVGLILHAAQRVNCRGPMNLGSPQPVTNEQLTRAIAQRLNRPVMPRVPSSLIRLVLGQMSELVLTSQRMSPATALETGYAFKFTKLEDALNHLEH